MSVDAAIPQPSSEHHFENVLTFIVPAPEGCDLDCPFCFIRRRAEQATEGILGAADYSRFVSEASAVVRSIDAVCIQGYEPLLPISFPFTREILIAAKRYGIPTGLVTNGTHLALWAVELAKFAPDKIAISIDAADYKVHDRKRRRKGAWHQSMVGILTALEVLPPTTEITVTSVLLPKQVEKLFDIPDLLREIGIKKWTISPLLNPKEYKGGVAGDAKLVFKDIIELSRRCAPYNIELSVDDNLGSLVGFNGNDQKLLFVEDFSIRSLKKPSSLIRLLPNGQCSMGYDILKQVSQNASRWLPGSMNAGKFIQRLRSQHNALYLKAA